MIHIRQPAGSRCCGQACLAMVLGLTLADVCEVIGRSGTHYKTLRRAAAAFGRELGPIAIRGVRGRVPPTRGTYICRAIWSRKPHVSHFIVLDNNVVLDPAAPIMMRRVDWLTMQSNYWGLPNLNFTSWVNCEVHHSR